MARSCRSFVPLIAIVGSLLAGCAGISPTAEPRQILAPSGKLRVGLYPGSPTSTIRDAATGESKGVGFDLGKEMARRLGVPFEPVVFPKNAEVLAAVKSGEVDVTFTNATAERARDMDFTPPFLDVEKSYLVPGDSRIATLADLDKPGIKVGVSAGSSTQVELSSVLKHVQIVLAPTLKGAIEMLSQRKIDAFATNKAILFEMSDQLPGSRVLSGRWGLEHFSVGIPKGRDSGMPWVKQFVADATADGAVHSAVARAGIRGTVKPLAAP